MVKNINTTTGTDGLGNYSYLTPTGGTLFFIADNGINGYELWKSDGTEAGTVMVKDIMPGLISSYPGLFSAIGNTLFFTASDGISGAELWRSDGTVAGTVMVTDLNPGTPYGVADIFK